MRINNKYRKPEYINFYNNYFNLDKQDCVFTNSDFINSCHRLANNMLTVIEEQTVDQMIQNLTYDYDVIKYLTIIDKGSKKERVLGIENVIFALFENLAKDASLPMFNAKLGIFQCASIKGRGQSYGKKYISKWMRSNADATRYYVKADIKKCYPSIPLDNLMNFIKRDLAKCDQLIYLYEVIFKLYNAHPEPNTSPDNKGILIGSPASKDLCNYYLSYLYHYIEQNLYHMNFKNAISHMIFYMDDFIIFGPNKKRLKRAMKLIIDYVNNILGLSIKSNWFIAHTPYLGKGNKIHGTPIDFMGFVFHGGKVLTKYYLSKRVRVKKIWVTVRGRIFLSARRKFNNVKRFIINKHKLKQTQTHSVIAYFGWFKHSNSYKFCIDNKLYRIMTVCKSIISDYNKKKYYDKNKYYNKWRKVVQC